MKRKEEHKNDAQDTMKHKEEGCPMTHAELWDKYLRDCAEFDNARKRWAREKEEIVKFSNFLLIKELVVILDELQHALTSLRMHSDQEEIAKGIELTRNNLFGVLKKEGVTEIESFGKKFDPHIHEIVGQVPDDDKEEHTVVDEVQRGYLLGGKVLRTSKVIISVRKEEERPPQTDEIDASAEIEQGQEENNNGTEQ